MKKTAFTLIELSLVLLVLSILVAGAISVSGSAVRNDKIKITQERMKAVYKAIGIYVSKNYGLPCPASLVKKKDDVGYGAQVGSTGSCTNYSPNEGVYSSNLRSSIVYGMVPIRELNLPVEMSEDGFGNKIIYIINQYHTIREFPDYYNYNGFSFKRNFSNDEIQVVKKPENALTEGVVMVLLSAGPNRFGAFGTSSTSQNATSTNIYEQQNYLSNINSVPAPHAADFGLHANYPTKITIAASDSSDATFDDIVFFKTRNDILFDFDATFLKVCDNGSSNTSGYNHRYYGQVSYLPFECNPPDNGKYPSKVCGFNDIWYDKFQCP